MTGEGTGIAVTKTFACPLPRLNKVTTATILLMLARVVTNMTMVSSETTATMVATLEDTVDKDPLSLVLTIATTLNPQADSLIVS